MFGVLIVTHGRLSTELLATAEMIGGPQPGIEALALDWRDDVEQAKAQIAGRIGSLDRGEGVLILTDMFGDTPSNAAAALAEPGRVEVLAGVNLPMVVRLSCSDVAAMAVGAAARLLEQKGKRSIGSVAQAPASGPPATLAGTRR